MLRNGIVAALTATALLTGCSAQVDAPPPATPGPTGQADGPTYSRYVALGDSFTAGPFVPTTDLADGCLRSNGNYPSLVADRIGVDQLVDVSCSAADTRDLYRPQETYEDTSVPAQLDALGPDTDLVTLGIGGNDFNLFGTLLRTCTGLRGIDPNGSPCTDDFSTRGEELDTTLARIGDRIREALARIQERAPDARVLLVGYPRIAPESGTCPDLLPLADRDYDTAGQVTSALREEMREAAGAADVGFIDLYEASEGHDVCSEDPWVNGQQTDRSAALALHPFAVGMEATADRIVDRLTR